jgi:hypothetical protein
MLAGGDKDARMKALEAATSGGGGGGSTPPKPSLPSRGSSGFSASANVGGLNMSYKSPATTPAATPAAVAVPSATPKMSSSGKPMPIQEEGEEL